MNHGSGTVRIDTGQGAQQGTLAPAVLLNAGGRAPVVLVCEHASHFIPPEFAGLGLSAEGQLSHVAWDPGASAVARMFSAALDAPLVESAISRLVYDCNRPPDAADAMPARSETFDVPGNVGLTADDRACRAALYYAPFRDLLAATLDAAAQPVLVTVHSFTPLYFGKPRDVGLGILHDSDSRLADAMLPLAAAHTDVVVARNQPYGPDDGVTHTLQQHGLTRGAPNVMLELRNDLIATAPQQRAMARALTGMLAAALADLDIELTPKGDPCSAP